MSTPMELPDTEKQLLYGSLKKPSRNDKLRLYPQMEGVNKQPSFPLCPMQKPDHTHCGQSTPVLPFAPHTYQHLRQEKRPPALRNKGLEVSPVTLPPLQLPLTGLRSGFFNSALALSTKTQSTQALFITTATHPQP